MKKVILKGLIGLSLSEIACAADTATLDEVIVTATRTPQQQESVIADVSVINAEEIKRGGQSTLIELLQRQPGIEITNNGGAGKTSGVFMRGTNTGHTLVLIDGVRVQSATAGTTTLENIPIQQIDRIEIVRGPATSLYGQDAIGGVIQIFTKKGVDGFKPYANLGFGTYDTTLAEAGLRGKQNDTAYALNVSANKTNGFSSLDTSNPNLNDKDGYRNLAVTGNLSHKIAEGHEVGLTLMHSKGRTRFDNSYNLDPSSAFNPAFSDYANLQQDVYSLFSKNQILNNWHSTVRISQGIDETVNYAALGPFTSESRSLFRTKQDQFNWQNDITLPLGTLTLMYDKLIDRVNSTTDFDKTRRTNEGYVASYVANIGAHSFQASAREDHNSSFGNNVTGGLGYGYNINDQWRVTGSYGSAFKAPTFNDLYYPGYSNPNLKPEKSDNLEASLRYRDDTFNASLTAYENKIRNLIVLGSLPENINKATIQGITLAASNRWDNLDVGGSVDIQSPRDDETDKLLRRRANRHGQMHLGYSLQDWRFGAEMVASSARYEDAANTLRMSGYTLFNMTAQYKVNRDWTVQARANNIFDKHYYLAIDGNGFAYNTPGANLFVNIRYEPQ
ncbi:MULTISPECIES: TonB-dependent receptor domain-containing protein [unclassified Methylophilus]|jgi:vitamin B12 transporter|uniref:TonB-dependent receptor domain-containing protein n=1 Tax=unclassified Methylophilus TaxID=2630143 RepID=UPI0006489D52|nr:MULTISPECIES: TonB-dependent receptor [unclassified Methylophilus]HCU84447.1 TonB-dependent receptor [Methylophilus sp.]